MGEDIVHYNIRSITMRGIIYCAINKINNKRYVGQTIQTLEERMKQHLNKNGCPYFHHAIVKYGKDSFEWKIIDRSNNYDDLNRKEKFWISFFETTNPSKGYNITNGGQSGIIVDDNLKRKNRDSFLKKYGKNYSKDIKKRNIRCIETQEVFISAAEAGRIKNIHKGHIASAASGTLKTAGGFHWEWCLELTFFPNAIYCKELDKTYLSFYDAHREDNFSSTKLSRKFKETKSQEFSYAGYNFLKLNYKE